MRVLAPTLLLVALLAAAACSDRAEPPAPPGQAPPDAVAGGRAAVSGPPRLVVLLVVDQLPQEVLLRVRSQLQGGLERLLKQGILYADAHQDHGATLTCSGHAALVTGRHPARNGIIGNDWYDRHKKRETYCAADDRHGRSPVLLVGETLGGWMKGADRRSRVFSAGGKDRSAVMLGGHRAEAAFWYDRATGGFTSSSYYPEGRPRWLPSFNAAHGSTARAGELWEPLPADHAAAGIVPLRQGDIRDGFPRALGRLALKPGSRFHADFYASPFIDEALVRLAEALIREEKLGADASPDLLALGFSAADSVGHTYGPNSAEYLDVLLRLDREIGSLMRVIDRQVGAGRVLYALSSDHGVAPLPELAQHHGHPVRRARAEDVRCMQQAALDLDRRFGKGWLLNSTYFDHDHLAARGVTPAEAAAALAVRLQECEAVDRVWTREDLQGDAQHPLLRLHRNSFHPQRSGDVVIQLDRLFVSWLVTGTTHGSPYRYDTHVPLVLAGAGVRPGRVDRRVRTVDLAPTLADLLGIPAPEDVDGGPLPVAARTPEGGP